MTRHTQLIPKAPRPPSCSSRRAIAPNAALVRLFQMSLNDERRKAAAWSLLGQIEIWRIEYGRPANEPRHPEIDSGPAVASNRALIPRRWASKFVRGGQDKRMSQFAPTQNSRV